VRDFVARHAGDHAADVLVDAVMAGIYSGDVTALSARATLRAAWDAERRSGSLLRDGLTRAFARLRATDDQQAGSSVKPQSAFVRAAAAAPSVSFVDGMSTLPRALVAAAVAHGATMATGVPAVALRRVQHGGGVVVQLPPTLPLPSAVASHPAYDAATRCLRADAVIAAVPPAPLARLVSDAAPGAAAAATRIPTASLAIACLGYADRGGGVERALSSRFGAAIGAAGGFGYLQPSADRRAAGAGHGILGAVWDSAVFPGQARTRTGAPPGVADCDTRVSVMMGGAVSPHVVAPTVSDDAVAVAGLRAAVDHLGLPATPDVAYVVRAPAAIPQYVVGHVDVVASLRTAAAATFGPTLALCGNGYDGVGVADCIAHGAAAARAVAAVL